MKYAMKQLLLALPLLALVACGEKNTPASSSAAENPGSPPSAAPPSFEAWFTATPPADPQAIHLARHQVQPGDEITLSGRVMGRTSVFVEGRAAFILGDPEKLTPCNEIPGDECPTPWDVCCDTKEAKREGTATIQIAGEDGRVLSGSLKGVGGLTELSRVIVQGTVDRASSAEALIVNARAIHVVP